MPTVQVAQVITPSATVSDFLFTIPAAPALTGVALEVQGLVDRAPDAVRFTSWRTVVIE